MIIPNQNIVNNKIVNHTMQASLRAVIPFGIAYEADIAEAREVVLGVVKGDDRIRERPPPEVGIVRLAASSVDMELRLWVKNPHHAGPIPSEYLEKIKLALDAAGIAIPYPQLSVRVEQLPEARTPQAKSRKPDGESP